MIGGCGMPPTLGSVLRIPRLKLRLRTGEEHLDRPVRWVAVSELTDPTPYLAGGELLLTTGVRWHETRQTAREYVRRLAGNDISGLGFGSGVAHDEVPPSLVEAAHQCGLPLVEVPQRTPFIAVGKEVSRLLAKEEYEGLSWAFSAQRHLTRAALRGAESVVDRLAGELGTWALLLGADGLLRHAAPADAARHAGIVEPDVRKLRASRQRASASAAVGGETVALQPLGEGGRLQGVLAVGAAHRLGPEGRTLVNAAVSLLSLELDRAAGPGHDRQRQEGLLSALLNGAVDLGHSGAARLRETLPGEPVTLAVAEADTGEGPPMARELENCLHSEEEGRILVLGSAADDPAGALVRAVGGPVGAAEPGTYGDLPVARSRAERALAEARNTGRDLMRAAELPGGFLGMVDTAAGTRVSRELLAPLEDHRLAETLVRSLRAYLAAAGRWDTAAESLGVHRHTLRYRIARVRELLPGDLDDPDYRAELWLALRTAGHPPRP
ncbi:purine catabolism regulator [Haloactinospora alba]|uniref:Purine catabolism regulator n=2 Tax=Haloactinospora alba TaxID=405555 RepID=A0A543NG60_9ACTN|nr:purine catabolism regulator [Haloactinospora alba]